MQARKRASAGPWVWKKRPLDSRTPAANRRSCIVASDGFTPLTRSHSV